MPPECEGSPQSSRRTRSGSFGGAASAIRATSLGLDTAARGRSTTASRSLGGMDCCRKSYSTLVSGEVDSGQDVRRSSCRGPCQRRGRGLADRAGPEWAPPTPAATFPDGRSRPTSTAPCRSAGLAKQFRNSRGAPARWVGGPGPWIERDIRAPIRAEGTLQSWPDRSLKAPGVLVRPVCGDLRPN